METMTLRELLNSGVSLCPIVDSPFTNTCWRVGFYYNGMPHALNKSRFANSSEVEKEIARIMEIFNNSKGEN